MVMREESESKKGNEPIKEKEKERGIASRKLALEVLLRVDREGAYSNIALASALEKCGLSKRDRAFTTLLVQGVIRNKGLLDSRIQPLSKKSLESIPKVLLNILRLGFFQLDFVEDLPPSAVLFTSTGLARKCGHEGLAKYTNAVLRSYLRQKESGLTGTGTSGSNSGEDDDDAFDRMESITNPEELATKHSMPSWMVKRWISNLGQDATRSLLEKASSKPDTFIRTNTEVISPEGLVSVLENVGIKLIPSRYVNSVFKVVSNNKQRLEDLPAYQEGLFSIQDEAAALVSSVVSPQKEEIIIDLCSAPGGKSLHMSELMENTGRIIAVDKYEKRFGELKKNRRRLGLTNIEIKVEDGRKFRYERAVDRVLVDAPCSGTGVMDRRSDIRHRRKPEDLVELPRLQIELLKAAAEMVKPGGIVVYSTCSLEPEENLEVIEKFLEESEGQFELEPLADFLPESIKANKRLSVTAARGFITLHPGIDNLSGFFIARLKRLK
jgi:16S rRNA (cytosine967-C5)-methyltransferase